MSVIPYSKSPTTLSTKEVSSENSIRLCQSFHSKQQTLVKAACECAKSTLAKSNVKAVATEKWNSDEINGSTGGAKSLLNKEKKKTVRRDDFRQELTKEQQEEIKEAFDLFDATGTGIISLQDLKVALRALGFEPAKTEIKRLINGLDKPVQPPTGAIDRDKEGTVTVDFQDFVSIMTTKISEKDAVSELKKAFVLFSENKDHITLEDLQYIARELDENMTDDELREMIFEANRKSGDGVVDQKQFLEILEKPE